MATKPPHIVIRADSSKEIGFGHITRSLTLAEALTRKGARVTCLGQGMTAGTAIAPSFEGLHVQEAEPSGGQASAIEILDLAPDAVITDGYHYSPEFYAALSDAGIPYAVIDDGGQTLAPDPRVVINQNPDATPELYGSMIGNPQLLLGGTFALLRPEVGYLAAHPPEKGNHTVVSLGGTDAKDLTIPMALCLLDSGHRVSVANRFRQGIIEALPGMERNGQIDFFAPKNLLPALASAQLAVVGAGTSLWEANALGTPTIGVIVADNQQGPARAAAKLGIIEGIVDATVTASTDATALAVAEAIRAVAQTGPTLRLQADGASRVAETVLAELSRHREDTV